MERIVDISSEGLHISVYRGFLTVNEGNTEKGRIPLDDVGALITHAHGLTWSNSAIVKLAERSIPVVVCAPNHAPVACIWPLEGHHLQGARLRLQVEASKPLKKQLWQQLIVAKIQMQGAVVASLDLEDAAFKFMARRVRSGDPDNLEAQAARRYWPLVMGEQFRRDPEAGGVNAMLNYGYTVLRAIVARAICASGLHPTLGLKHSNRSNAFALADDLMEPFRPLVDRMVFNIHFDGETEVTPIVKATIARLGSLDLHAGDSMSTLATHASHLLHSLTQSFAEGKADIKLPSVPAKDFLTGLGRNTQ